MQIGVKRPSYGTAGRPYAVFTNNFEVSCPEELIIHYDGKPILPSISKIAADFKTLQLVSVAPIQVN